MDLATPLLVAELLREQFLPKQESIPDFQSSKLLIAPIKRLMMVVGGAETKDAKEAGWSWLGNTRWRCAQSSLKNGRTRSRRDSSSLRTGLSTCGLVTSTSSTQKLLAAHLRSALSIHRASADHPFDAWHPFRFAAPGYSRAQGASADLQVDG